MIGLRTILVATDLSSLSNCAVRYGCELAGPFRANVHLLTVVSYPFSEFVQECRKDYGRSIDEFEAQLYAAAETRLSEIDAVPLEESQVTRVVEQGFPVETILRYAESSQADLLVLGTHGLTGLKHVLMGSVAETIVRTASCPVLTVRDPVHQFVSLNQSEQ
jgi:nucleotide-binding universal stress UspA family protein